MEEEGKEVPPLLEAEGDGGERQDGRLGLDFYGSLQTFAGGLELSKTHQHFAQRRPVMQNTSC